MDLRFIKRDIMAVYPKPLPNEPQKLANELAADPRKLSQFFDSFKRGEILSSEAINILEKAKSRQSFHFAGVYDRCIQAIRNFKVKIT